VDVEVEHDPFGLPVIRGQLLHGLLRDAWRGMARHFPDLAEPARQVLGGEGDLRETTRLRIGDAVLPADVQAWVRFAVNRKDDPLPPEQVLRTLTGVRRQAARDRVTGAADPARHRSSRVVLRTLRFNAPLAWLAAPEASHLRALALCALGVRHAGPGRNRGRGHVLLSLDGDVEVTRRLATGSGGTA